MNRPNFSSFPELTSQRFCLRQVVREDDNEIFALRADKNIAKYLNRPRAQSVNDAREFIKKINSSISENELTYWGITRKGEDKLLGTICLWKISIEHSKAEIGFELLTTQQGKGIMQEVIPKVIEFGFKNLGLSILEAEVAFDNIKSIKLLEKFGFKPSKSLKNTLIYELLNSHKEADK
ncbi:MAG: GNAT family N-acetyltransferase [Ignavibacteria bacterium]|nr:GNAT family N-acetyltransferase [Ignavibacteria bacterium]